jgi:hypothetical protein
LPIVLSALIALSIVLALPTLLRATALADDKPPLDKLLVVRKGTLPIILSAPHGGRQHLLDVPERKGDGIGKFVTVRDDNTAELAEKLAAEVQKKLGGTPYVVIALFERKYLDVNRPAADAYESDKAKPSYEADRLQGHTPGAAGERDPESGGKGADGLRSRVGGKAPGVQGRWPGALRPGSYWHTICDATGAVARSPATPWT